MNRNFRLVRIICLLLFQLVGMLTLLANQDTQFKNRVNLALRQTGHQLLLSQQDSTSTIAPVEYRAASSFLLPLNGAFNYDTLPALLKQAFEDYCILEPYEVLVLSCETGIPFLGYNSRALNGESIACIGRDQKENCADIFVQFSQKAYSPPSPLPPTKKAPALVWLLLPIVAGLGFFLFKKVAAKPNEALVNDHLQLGQYSFDPKNQRLHFGDEIFDLTFRENKLLHFFASRPNEVLNRTDILAAVWEEEGVLVGRSLDVFISRLRKLLKQDPSVQIKNIHGVGYRLSIQ